MSLHCFANRSFISWDICFEGIVSHFNQSDACNSFFFKVKSCATMASPDLNEKANFTRLSRLLVDKGTEALRNTFDGIHSPTNLSAVLSANKTCFLKLKPRVINNCQWDLLYPPSGNPPDSKTFDVTLLAVLFRNICPTLTAPKTGWNAMPVDADRSTEANIVRIKLLRNKVFAHVTSTQLDIATFKSLWEMISQALLDLNICQEDIDELKTCPLEQSKVCEEYKTYVKILKDWKTIEEKLESFESRINHLTQTAEENREEIEQMKQSKEKEEDLLRKLAKHNFKGKIRNKGKSFLPGTREWLLKEVEKWFIGNEHESMIFLLKAGPGFGKTVFSARVCEDFQEKAKLAGCHFCDFSDSNLRNPMMMLESLASQMCDNVVGFKEKLIDQLRRHHKVQNLRDAFRIYLQNPLDELELAEPHLIVIDGLDESAADDKNEIVHLIADYFPDLPKFIKVLVTSRPEISVDKLNGCPEIDVDNSNADNNSDLKTYLRSCLPSLLEKKKRRLGKEDSEVFEKLVEMCEGSFLYAFFVQSELQKRDDLDQMMPDEITEFLPKGLDSVYNEYFRRLEDELKGILPGNFDVLNIMEMLVASKGPLPLTFITMVLGLAPDCRETKNIIKKVNAVVSCLLYVSDDQVTVFHKSVIDWLLARGYKDHEYTVKVIDGDRSIWIICEQVFEEIKKTICSEDHLNLTNNSNYAVRHGLQHLISCRITESYTWLVDVAIVYLILYEGNINQMLELWDHFFRVNERISDAKLGGRISWHMIELDNFKSEEMDEDLCRWYLASVVAHSPRSYFSEEDWGIAKTLLSKYSTLININCKHKVEIIPHEVRHDYSRSMRAACLSNDKSKAAFSEYSGTVTLVDVPSLDELWQLAIDHGGIPCCTFAPDDSFILFGKLETALSVADGKEVPFFHNNKETFVSCRFSPNGKRLVTGNESRTIKLWDIARQSILSSLCTENPIKSCSFSSTGLFIIANTTSSFCVWNAVTWQRCDERIKKREAIVGDLCKRCFPGTFELPAFKRLNVKPRQPLPSWNSPSETLSTGIFKGVECHFVLDKDSLSVVENTHFTTVACWNIAFNNCHWDQFVAIATMIDDNLWLYAARVRLIVFETLVSTPKQFSRLHGPARVYSSCFSPDSSRLATCTSDGYVNIWNVDSNQVDQRFKCNPEESPFACWWSQKFLFVSHVLNGSLTLSKYPMNANLKLSLSPRDTCHFLTENLNLLTVVDFSEGFFMFECGNEKPVKVFDVISLREVTLPEIEPKMRLTVSRCCSFVLGTGMNMFNIWKRNEVEAHVFTVFFKGPPTTIDAHCVGVTCGCFSSDTKVAVVAYSDLDEHVSVHDLDTGSYKLVKLEPRYYYPIRVFCFNEVLICAMDREINIYDLDTGVNIDHSKQRYLVEKFQMQMKLSPNGATLAIPMTNGDMEFIGLSIAQNSILPSLKAEAIN